MDLRLIWAALIVVFALVLSGFFSGAETALTAASRARMNALEKAGNLRARLVNRLVAKRERLIGAMLLGNQFVNIATSAFLTSLLVEIAGDSGAIYATAILTVLILIFAEILPKTLALQYGDRMSLMVAPLASVCVTLFTPILYALETGVKFLLWPFDREHEARSHEISGRDELMGTIDLLHQEGEVEREDRDRVGGVLDLEALCVSDVMVHRTKIRALNLELPAEQILREVISAPYTRLPLWRERPDNIVGVIHARDVLRAMGPKGNGIASLTFAAIMRAPWFVPAPTTLKDQLEAFLQKKQHLAFVVDEYGEMMGLITLEDIMEEIVGDIKDEHDLTVPGVKSLPDGVFLVEGSVPIRDLNRLADWELSDEHATTVAGLVIHEARTIPDVGQVFHFYGYRFEIVRKYRNRIISLKVSAQQK